MLKAALVFGLVVLSSCQIAESDAEGKKAPAAAAAKSFKVGDAVDAQWEGRWYEATVTAAGKTYDVKYGDGTTGEKLAANRLRAIVEGGPYKVGDRAEAVSADSGLYAATIISVTGDTYGVVADTDGSTWDKLTVKKLRPLPGKPLKAGTKVWGQWTTGSWYPGKITALNKDGTFKVTYDDGDSSPALTRAQIGYREAVASSGGSAGSEGNCPGPGIVRRCNGVCTPIQDNDQNCGGCGDICNAGFHCQGLFCRDASGNLGSTHR